MKRTKLAQAEAELAGMRSLLGAVSKTAKMVILFAIRFGEDGGIIWQERIDPEDGERMKEPIDRNKIFLIQTEEQLFWLPFF